MSGETERLLYIGLMSGTSADGVDAALCRFDGIGDTLEWELVSFKTHPYPPAFSRTLLQLPDVDGTQLSALNVEVGEKLADAAQSVLDAADVSPDRVQAIGSHGHTVYHGPDDQPPSTLQFGEEAIIAERTGIPVIGDFRVSDVAAGGEGAPLSPMADWLLWQRTGNVRVIVNIGGIVNPTYLPPDDAPEDVMAFDSGPGNMLLDDLARRRDVGPYDENGEVAAEGTPIPALVKAGLEDPYVQKPPPKTTGRNMFGSDWVDQWLVNAPPNPSTPDLLASGTELVARCLTDSIKRFFPNAPEELVLAGGGRHNRDLVDRVRSNSSATVRRAEEAGIDGDAREAIAFALFAHLAEHENPATLPQVTGATHPSVPGKRTPPSGRPQKS